MSSDHTYQTVLEFIRSKDNDYSLVIVGDNPYDTAPKFYAECAVSVLVLFGNEEDDEDRFRDHSRTISPAEDSHKVEMKEIRVDQNSSSSEDD